MLVVLVISVKSIVRITVSTIVKTMPLLLRLCYTCSFSLKTH